MFYMSNGADQVSVELLKELPVDSFKLLKLGGQAQKVSLSDAIRQGEEGDYQVVIQTEGLTTSTIYELSCQLLVAVRNKREELIPFLADMLMKIFSLEGAQDKENLLYPLTIVKAYLNEEQQCSLEQSKYLLTY